jgi:hypothetical protein
VVTAAVYYVGPGQQHDSHSGHPVTQADQADLHARFYAHPFASYQEATTLTLVIQQFG